MTGVILNVFLTRGFGFVVGEDDVSRFLHAKDVKPVEDFARLHEGLAVEFEPEQSPKGPRAVNIRIRRAV